MSRLADPKILIAINDLSLAAKTIVDGFMAGIHISKVRGSGVEFSQYRSYQPGDDLRKLDWKLFARSDRYYIRDSEIETGIGVRFLVDASASMNHEDSGFTKIEYARYIAASLAYLANRQGDSTGLYILQNEGGGSLAPRPERQQLSRLFHMLEKIKPQGTFDGALHYRNLAKTITKKELVIVITDFHQQGTEIVKFLHALSTAKHEIIVFHLMGKNELELNYPGITTLEDLETRRSVQLDTSVVKSYREKLDAHLKQIRSALAERNISYQMMSMDESLDLALLIFLNQRNKISR
jgi:uncharacterized protein (DUF58 family)